MAVSSEIKLEVVTGMQSIKGTSSSQFGPATKLVSHLRRKNTTKFLCGRWHGDKATPNTEVTCQQCLNVAHRHHDEEFNKFRQENPIIGKIKPGFKFSETVTQDEITAFREYQTQLRVVMENYKNKVDALNLHYDKTLSEYGNEYDNKLCLLQQNYRI